MSGTYIRYPAFNFENSLILDGSTSGALTFTVPAVVTSYTIIWPAAQGAASTFLQNDGAGNLSWVVGSGSSGVTTIGTINSQTKSANGAVISGANLIYQTADASFPGLMSIGTQTIAGAKTFSDGVVATVTGHSSLDLAIASNLSDVNNATTSFNNISGMTTLGDLIYGGASGTRTRLAGNTTATKKYLNQTGDAVNSAAPAWGTISADDIAAGTLPIARGGTNNTSYTSGSVLYFDNTKIAQNNAQLFWDQTNFHLNLSSDGVVLDSTLNTLINTVTIPSLLVYSDSPSPRTTLVGISGGTYESIAVAGSVATPTSPNNFGTNAQIGNIRWQTYNPGTGAKTTQAAVIARITGAAANSNAQTTELDFQTNNNSAVATQMILKSDGTLNLTKFSSAGVVHNDSSGNLSTSAIVNADVDAAAAIAYSKLNLGTSIVNADVSTSAAIAYSKLATLATGSVLLGNAGTPTATALSGDITVGATGITAIGSGKVTNAMLAGSIDLATKMTGVLPIANEFTNSNQLQNLGLAVSISSNTLVVALKQADGSTDPASGSGAVNIAVRSTTATTGSYSVVSQTAAASITLAAADSIGVTAASAQILYVYYVQDTTSEVGLSVTLFDQGTLVTTSALTGSADTDATKLWTTSAHTSRPIRLIGYLVATWSNPNWGTIANVALAPFAGNLMKLTATATAGGSAVTSTGGTAGSNGTVTWVCPNHLYTVMVTGRGGGGGGGGGGNSGNGSGGGGGATASITIPVSVVPGTSYTLTAGAGGAGGNGANGGGSDGSTGTDSTFGSLATFKGASGGSGGGARNMNLWTNAGAIGYGTSPGGGGGTPNDANTGAKGGQRSAFALGGAAGSTGGGGGGGGDGVGGAGGSNAPTIGSIGTSGGGGGGGGQGGAASTGYGGGAGGTGQITVTWIAK